MSWFSDYSKRTEKTDQLTAKDNHVKLLSAGLFGETGSVLAELKKMERETNAYPFARYRLVDEIGDVLWYFSRLVAILAPSELDKLDNVQECTPLPRATDPMTEALALAVVAGNLLSTLNGKHIIDSTSQLCQFWGTLLRVASATNIDLEQAKEANLQKTTSRWPLERKYASLFDDEFCVEEQLPRMLIVTFKEIDFGDKKVVLLRCNGLNLGDRLTDNIQSPDSYRFHDIFHLAHAAYLGWSPVLRALLNCKRKSKPEVDENQDGARARIIEEAVSAIVFSSAKENGFYEGVENVDYELLKTISEFVSGFEVDEVPAWQWEEAILNGYRVFRDLRDNGGGTVTIDLINHDLCYGPPN